MVDQTRGRLLAFDYGVKQIGLAVGNGLLGTTEPLQILRARHGQPDWDEVATLLAEWRPDLLIVGDPLNMDGSVSDLTRRARRFARRLQGRFGIDTELVDERLSSFEVKHTQRELGHKGDYNKCPVDSLAAELLLKDWLRARRAPESAAGKAADGSVCE